MQKNVREIAVLMQDKEKEYKICEKLRRQPEPPNPSANSRKSITGKPLIPRTT